MTHTMKPLLLATVLSFICLADHVASHSYHLGSCPVVEPMQDFKMDRMLGKWYVIQKTSTGSKCLTYDFTSTGEPYEYKIEQISEHPILGLANVDNQYHYTGVLTVPHRDVPAKMTVRFPLSVAGSASYTVFTADYDTYAAIFTCQSLAFANRQSATILSRKKTLDKIYIDKIRSKLAAFGVDPFELSIIDQSGCPETAFNITINEDTFSPQSIAGVVRKAGEKIGDGVEVAAEGARKVYNALSHKHENHGENRREEIIEDQSKTNDAEWLP